MVELAIVPIARVELSFSEEPWLFAFQRRVEIDAYFANRKRENSALWNGKVLLLRDPVISENVFRGVCFPVDYASFLAWRDWGFPADLAKENVARGALRSADGAFLLGVTADHTSHPGDIHFPSGLPDLNDVVGASVDLHSSMMREVREETGLLSSYELVAAPHWYTVFGGPQIAHFKVLQSKEDAASLRARILAYLKCDPQSELADIRIVRSAADLHPKVAITTATFLKHMWRELAD